MRRGARSSTPPTVSSGFRHLLPPPPRRGLILIDPSYEDKQDYTRVVKTLREAMTRFATGCYAIWYPQVHRHEPDRAGSQADAVAEPALAARERHGAKPVAGRPRPARQRHVRGQSAVDPDTRRCDACLPWLTEVLRQDDGARWTLDTGGRRTSRRLVRRSRGVSGCPKKGAAFRCRRPRRARRPSTRSPCARSSSRGQDCTPRAPRQRPAPAPCCRWPRR